MVRLANRLTHRLPPFLATMGPVERRIASWSEYLLYALLLVQTADRVGHAVGRPIPDRPVGPFLCPGSHRTTSMFMRCSAVRIASSPSCYF